MPLEIFRSADEFAVRYGLNAPRCALAIGNFDGMHLGHQKILRGVIEKARQLNARAVAVTFDPHPLRLLRPADAPPLLIPLDERLAYFEMIGLDIAVVLRFDAKLAQLSPEQFVQGILVEKLNVGAVIVGNNFRFGHRQAGDATCLTNLGREFGFTVECVSPVVLRGVVVSSTIVRHAIQDGEVTRAGRWLGRPIALRGEIRPGTGQGRQVVVPTLNLAGAQELLPKIGVYVTETVVAGRVYRSATNVGMRPTFDATQLSIESHLFDFGGEVTSGPMEIRFWRRLRDERKFSGPEALREQVLRDLARAKRFFRLLDRLRHTRQPA